MTHSSALQMQFDSVHRSAHYISAFVGPVDSSGLQIGLPMELLYADDLVLVAETEKLQMEKLRKWKKGYGVEKS